MLHMCVMRRATFRMNNIPDPRFQDLRNIRPGGTFVINSRASDTAYISFSMDELLLSVEHGGTRGTPQLRSVTPHFDIA